jgi:SAM-dependent methyltransferase
LKSALELATFFTENYQLMNAVNSQEASRLNANFLEEYNSQESTLKYTRKTAGHGISYLLDHDYKNIYLECIEKYVPKSRLKAGIRLWEFGCGGGMNLLHLVSILGRQGIAVDRAYGTDFSETLIAAAQNEAGDYLSQDQRSRVRFAVARNEGLIEEGTKGLDLDRKELLGSFDLIFGVNTIRYGHRLNNVDRCVEGIRGLLREGGVCVVIDMNRKFPVFRSRLREMVTRPAEKEETLLPTLEEYAQPFSAGGFEILKKKNFCWVPHSAGAGLTVAMRTLTPILNTVAPSRAMRSLVVSRKVSRGSR